MALATSPCHTWDPFFHLREEESPNPKTRPGGQKFPFAPRVSFPDRFASISVNSRLQVLLARHSFQRRRVPLRLILILRSFCLLRYLLCNNFRFRLTLFFSALIAVLSVRIAHFEQAHNTQTVFFRLILAQAFQGSTAFSQSLPLGRKERFEQIPILIDRVMGVQYCTIKRRIYESTNNLALMPHPPLNPLLLCYFSQLPIHVTRSHPLPALSPPP